MKLYQLMCLCLYLLAFTFQFRFCQLGKLFPPFLLYVSKQLISNSFSKSSWVREEGNVKSELPVWCVRQVIPQFYFIKSSDDFPFGPNLLIYYNNRTLSNSGLGLKRARLEYWFFKYLFLVPYFFVVKPLSSRLPWPVTFPQNIFCCEP